MDCTTDSYLMLCIHVHAVFTWHQLGHQRAWHQRSLLDAGYQHTSSFAHDCAHLFPPKERDVKSFAGINNILICKMLTSWHYHNLWPCKTGPPTIMCISLSFTKITRANVYCITILRNIQHAEKHCTPLK